MAYNYDLMKAQSAIEFLSTYSFLFIILGAVLAGLVILVSIPKFIIPTQCSFYSGQSCIYSSLYSNSSKAYSLFTLVFSNPQAVPINITNVSMLITSTSSTGICTPSTLYPGEEAVCLVPSNTVYRIGSTINGFFAINAKYCNSGISNLQPSNCTMTKVSYGGSFSSSVTNKTFVPYVAVAAISPKTEQNGGFQSSPVLPPGYTTMQYGSFSSSNGGYAYGTSGYDNNMYLGLKVVPFPNSLSVLNNNVACSPPYNSTFSLVYTTFYTPSGATSPVKIATDNDMELYYKSASSSTWSSVLSTGCCMSAYSGNVVSSPGLGSLAIAWTNICAPGAQVLNVTNLP